MNGILRLDSRITEKPLTVEAGLADKLYRIQNFYKILTKRKTLTTLKFNRVQEAIAAQIPFVVSHVVPGQEEGNIALIQQTGIGTLAAANPDHVLHVIKGAMANEGALWRTWRKNLVHLQKPSASQRIAKFLMEHAMN
jgi:hypothetical protein